MDSHPLISLTKQRDATRVRHQFKGEFMPNKKKKPIKTIKKVSVQKMTGEQALILTIKAENKKLEFLKDEAMARNEQILFQYLRGQIDRGEGIIEILKKF